jgi:predicted TIM-barrel fold metal-dependent hydrolase
MIIDVHAHLGLDQVFDGDITEKHLIEYQQANSIDLTIVQPCIAHDLDTVKGYHDRIAELAAKHPGKFKGMANPNPHLPGGAYEKEVRRCVEELKFIGLKIHPAGHAVDLAAVDGQKAAATANELGLPLMVHTGVGLPWAAPAAIGPVAKQYPKMKIIAAHAGMFIFSGEAGQLAVEHENVYLELTWTPGIMIKSWTRSLGADRLMFASDIPANAAEELFKVTNCGIDKQQQEMVLAGTAQQVYGL